MIYERIQKGRFLKRPNRFIAKIEINGKEETVHVKNTGRCAELLVPGAEVFVRKSESAGRKTGWDLISVRKADRLINMDSQVTNKVVQEWIEAGRWFKDVKIVRPEVTYKNSRFDLYVEYEEKKAFIEVKGVTLEEEGVVKFPDAPSERAVKHLKELEEAFKNGVKLFLYSNPNNPTGAVFSKEEVSEIARLAKKYDVAILADELYSRQILEKDFTYTHMRALPEKPDKLITIMGPSKTESLSGFRLGVGYGTPEIITRMEKLQAVVSLRCAGYNQAAFYRWFSEPDGWMEKRIADHRQIRDDILAVINSCPGCWARPTEGGSYIFMQLPKLKVDIFQFTKLCRAQASVTVTPGTEFGKQYGDFIRMNFSQDHDKAVDAVKRICKMVDIYRA